ncbi:unnamed protein product [Linum tenue]|uniref:Uncharacterized protein n=1 Tax=Linum tenue TaxID=586396 RepID=A0AAV0K867_9ROSI|nr:unnamed protein product [Linum tenue]
MPATNRSLPTSYWVYDLDCVLPCLLSCTLGLIRLIHRSVKVFMYRLLMKRRFQCLFLRALCCSSWLQVVRSCTIERSRQEQCQVQVGSK